MKQRAIDEALIRLDRVRQSIAVLERLDSKTQEFRTAWWTSILAANGIYSMLEQGSQGHGQSEAWFGRKMHERTKDDLLSYIHQARNSEEHSIEGSEAEHGVHVASGNKWTKVESDGSDGQGIRVNVQSGKELALGLRGPGIHLQPVENRGRVFQLPQQHLGKPLPERSIVGVLRLAENYLAAMIEEASKLPQHL